MGGAGMYLDIWATWPGATLSMLCWIVLFLKKKRGTDVIQEGGGGGESTFS